MKKIMLAEMLSVCLNTSVQAYTQYDVPAYNPLFYAGEPVVVETESYGKTSFYNMANNQPDALF